MLEWSINAIFAITVYRNLFAVIIRKLYNNEVTSKV